MTTGAPQGQAGPVAGLNPSTSVTQSKLDRIASRLANDLTTKPTFTKMNDDLPAIQGEYSHTYALLAEHHERMVSGSTLIRRQYAKTFLETFGPIWAPQQQPPVDPATLFSTSPSNNVSSRRDFWKPLAAYMIQSRKDYITVEKRPLLSASTAIANLTDAFAAFERMTGGKVDESIRTECYAYVRRTCPDQPREKPVATPRDLHLFVSEGVFSPRVVYRSSRERIQAALLPLLVSYGPARPSEAVLGNDQVEALRYEHVDYLLLYAPDCTPPFIPTTDVKLEHLKGARLKKGSYRVQPLYSSREIEAIQDASFYLYACAFQDDAFVLGRDVFSFLKNITKETFDGAETIKLEIKSTFMRKFVFRQIEGQGLRAAPTVGEKPWTYHNAKDVVKKAARAAGYGREFKLYYLRRMVLNRLNEMSPSISAESRFHSAGHPSSVFSKDYLDKRSCLDIQGAVIHGEENRKIVRAHGLRRLAERYEITLSAEEQAQLDKSPIIAGLLKDYEEAQAQHNVDPKTLVLMRDRLVDARSRAYADEAERLGRLQQQRASDGRLLALGGDDFDVSTALQDLIRDLRDDDDDEHDDDDQDDDAALAHGQLLDEDDDDDGALTHGQLLDEDDDDDGALTHGQLLDEDDDDDGALTHGQLLDEDDDDDGALTHGQLLDEDDDDDGALTHGQLLDEDDDDDGALTHGQSDDVAAITQQVLRGVSSQATVSVPIEEFDVQLLRRTGDARGPLHEELAIVTSESGTKAGIIEAIHRAQQCPHCTKSYCDPPMTLLEVEAHLARCQRQKLPAQCAEALAAALKGIRCKHARCDAKQRAFESDPNELRAHLDEHEKELVGAFGCPYLDDKGEPCTFRLRSARPEASRNLTLVQHAQIAHGLVVFNGASFVYCQEHKKHLIGHMMIEAHFDAHLLCLHEGRGEASKWESRCCAWCVGDESLPPSKRAVIHDSYLVQHVCEQHIYPQRAAEIQCPLCRKPQHIADILDHLVTEHGRPYGKPRSRKNPIRRNWAHLPALKGKSAWVEWVDPLIGRATSSPSAALNEATPGASAAAATSKTATKSRAATASSSDNGTLFKPLNCPYCGYKARDLQANAKHLAGVHIVRIREQVPKCPVCNEGVPLATFCGHLEEHGLCLSGKKRLSVNNDFDQLAAGADAKKLLHAWREAGCPEDAAYAPKALRGLAVKKLRLAAQQEHAGVPAQPLSSKVAKINGSSSASGSANVDSSTATAGSSRAAAGSTDAGPPKLPLKRAAAAAASSEGEQ